MKPDGHHKNFFIRSTAQISTPTMTVTTATLTRNLWLSLLSPIMIFILVYLFVHMLRYQRSFEYFHQWVFQDRNIPGYNVQSLNWQYFQQPHQNSLTIDGYYHSIINISQVNLDKLSIIMILQLEYISNNLIIQDVPANLKFNSHRKSQIWFTWSAWCGTIARPFAGRCLHGRFTCYTPGGTTYKYFNKSMKVIVSFRRNTLNRN